MKFRKKPVVVDAERVADLVDAAAKHWKQLPGWVQAAYDKGKLVFLPHEILVKTLEGDMRALHGDWLILGTQGEIYPCKPKPFADTFEPA